MVLGAQAATRAEDQIPVSVQTVRLTVELPDGTSDVVTAPVGEEGEGMRKGE
jgi:hypothetical protein